MENIIWLKRQIDIKLGQELLSNSDIVSTNDTPNGMRGVFKVPESSSEDTKENITIKMWKC